MWIFSFRQTVDNTIPISMNMLHVEDRVKQLRFFNHVLILFMKLHHHNKGTTLSLEDQIQEDRPDVAQILILFFPR